MNKVIKRVPVPIAGLSLAFAALENLIQSYSNTVRYIFGGISFVLLLLLILRIITDFNSFKNDMNNPIMASVFATFPMTIMLLSGYIAPFVYEFAFGLWLFGILLHLLLIVYFTVKFIIKLDFTKVFASYFIVYVGIVVASVTAPVFNMKPFGEMIFWFGLVCFIILAVLVTFRYFKFGNIAEPFRPLICIYAAPVSLLAAGYAQSAANVNKLLGFLLLISVVIYFIMLNKGFKFMFENKFYPSFSSLTFPFVISAIASKMTMAHLNSIENPISVLAPLVTVQTFIAVLFCFYVLYNFYLFLTE